MITVHSASSSRMQAYYSFYQAMHTVVNYILKYILTTSIPLLEQSIPIYLKITKQTYYLSSVSFPLPLNTYPIIPLL